MRLIIILNTSTIDELVTARKDGHFSPNGGMVDTQHLKCCDHYGRAGSSPVLGTKGELSFISHGWFSIKNSITSQDIEGTSFL